MTPTTTETRPERNPQAQADYEAIQSMLDLLERLRDQAAAMRTRNAAMSKVEEHLVMMWADLIAAVYGVEAT